MKTFLISIVSVVGLFVAATAVMFVFKACPPQGPWPSLPWCGEDGYQIKIPEISISEFQTPSPGSPATSDQPKAKSSAPFTIYFTVQVSQNTPNYTIVYLQIHEGNEWGRNLKMEKKAGNIWYLKADLRDFKNKEISYRYLRNDWGFVGAEEFSPDSKTASRKVFGGKGIKTNK